MVRSNEGTCFPMSLFRSVRTISQAEGAGPIDWEAVEQAATEAISPGTLELTSAQRNGYLTDVRDARAAVTSTANLDFSVPATFEVQNRHHWMEANIETFQRLMEPLAARQPTPMPGAALVVNTATMTAALAFLGRHVLGQYDPLLLADEGEHGLYFVHPNIERVAKELDVDRDRFRRWIAFHEVTHAAEFGAAPWLPDVLEQNLLEGIDALGHGKLDRDAFRALDATMTAVEGYAELLMDEAFDRDTADLRRKLDERRRRGGPIAAIFRRILGLEIKRRQYERGREFFQAVVNKRGIAAAGAVWERPEHLPEWEEFDHPGRWLSRVDP